MHWTSQVVIGLLSVAALYYCFVFVDGKGKNPQAMAKRFLYETLPNSVKWAIKKTLGETVLWAIERAISYTCYEANPAI